MQKQALRIVCAFLVLIVLSMLVYYVFGVNVQEGFLFSNPDNCPEVCGRAGYGYKNYCNSPYLKDGPAALCNCRWNPQNLTCEGTRALNTKCAL